MLCIIDKCGIVKLTVFAALAQTGEVILGSDRVGKIASRSGLDLAGSVW